VAITVIVTRHTRITSPPVRVHVAFTPAETAAVPTAIVVDVLRATSTIVQAVASGYRRVLCCAEIEEAKALRDELGDAVLAGERKGQSIPGLDLGNSPLEFLERRAETLVLTTTNGTRAIVEAASRCDLVLVGSLLNLDAVVSMAQERGEDVEVVCAGLLGAFALDDAYCAGRIVDRLGGSRTDAAEAAVRLFSSFDDAEEAFRTAIDPHDNRTDEDISWCARENTAPVVPRFVSMHGVAAEIVGA
jgi:2-phosphosulfolactate phosphatase